MAILHSIQSGNFTSASTWAVVDPISYLDSRASANGSVTTTLTNTSALFTPGAITISGVAIQIVGRITSPSGTITMRLWNNTAGSVVKDVTINATDLPSTGATSNPYIGWTYFKFDVPVTLLAATSYAIRMFSSISNQIIVYTNGVANNYSRALVTTTTAAPAATDTLITGGDFTSAGVNVITTITMNSTTTTQYGQCYIGSNGVFNYGVSASTNYVLRLAGDVWIGRSGNFTIGTVTNPIPATSTAVLEINCASALQFQIYNFGTLETKYATTVLHRALLNADIAVGATTSTANVSTGWKQNDVIAIPSTTRTTTQFERVTLNANAVGTTLTHNATSFAHDGNATIYMQADLANLTRSIKIRSVTGTFKTRFVQGLNAVTTFFDVEFFEMGTFIHNSGTLQYTGTFNTQQCTFWQTTSPGTTTLFSYISTTTYTLSNNVFYNYSDIFGIVNDNNLIIGFTGFGAMGGGSLGSNNVISSCSAAGLSGVTLISGSTGNRFYATGGNGAIYSAGSVNSYTISNYVFFNNSIACRFNAGFATLGSDRTVFEIFENCYFYGNVTNFDGGTFRKLQFNNCFFWAGKTGLLTAIGYTPFTNDYINFSNCTFGRRPDGVDSLFTTSCLRGAQAATTLTNCLFYGTQASFASTTIFTSVNGVNGVTSLKHNQITNEYRQYQSNGFIQNDNVITYNGLSTIRITPQVVTNKTFSDPVRVAVRSGQTCTISVLIRKSISSDNTIYNGNQPRLIYAFNPLSGNITETVAAIPINLFQYSQDFDNAYWTKTAMTITANTLLTTAPDGTNTADVYTGIPASGQTRIFRSQVTTTGINNFSIYVKASTFNGQFQLRGDASGNTANATFQFSGSVVSFVSSSGANYISNNIQSLSNGWYRISIVYNSPSAFLPDVTTFNPGTAGNFFIWGAQLTTGASLLPYYDNGQWEPLTYTTPAVANDCVLEFYVDCDGTTGWINIENFKTTTSNDTRGMDYWSTIGVYVEADWRRPGRAVTFTT